MQPDHRSAEINPSPDAQPRHAWLSFCTDIPPGARTVTVQMHQVAHAFLLLRRGGADGRLIVGGKASPLQGSAGAVQFHPADGLEHLLEWKPHAGGCSFAALLIPPPHLDRLAAADRIDRLLEWQMTIWPNDTMLRDCLELLTAPGAGDETEHAEERDDAARCLVLRLAELLGGRPPEWSSDGSPFDRRTFADLVERVDARLALPPSAADLAASLGMSPSHFARKFRMTCGWSYGRFLLRRRVRAALDRLQSPGVDLARLSFDLGFSSQSHLTRAFGAAVGMTPSAYRRHVRPTRG